MSSAPVGPVVRIDGDQPEEGARTTTERTIRTPSSRSEDFPNQPTKPQTAVSKRHTAVISMIDYEDELLTAVVTVKGTHRAIKIDTGARYTIAGTNWMSVGTKLRKKAPAQLAEGIGGFELKILGVWEFNATTVYGQKIQVEACVVEGCQDDFPLGEDFMVMYRASIDFSTNELRYDGLEDDVVLPFTTYDTVKTTMMATMVRSKRKWRANPQTVSHIEVAVTGPDGELGTFVPKQNS